MYSTSTLAFFTLLAFCTARGSPRGPTRLSKAAKYADLYYSFKRDANDIINYFIKGPAKGDTYRSLAELADTYGSRIVGSDGFAKANEYLVQQLKKDGLDNVHKEMVSVPRWVRGYEEAKLIHPRVHNMALLGIGGTVPTPKNGIVSDAVVVLSFDELSKLGKDFIKGKIVVYNQPWINYGQSVAYRGSGASRASALGAVAVLVRSAASHSIYSPATGMQNIDKRYPQIPAACITIEDAEMLYRMQNRNETLRIFLRIDSRPNGTVQSPNTIAQLTGSQYPNEIVLISGHFDSWDVGTGAMDDGGGVMLCWEALRVLKNMGLKPKRTIRAVFWTGEEEGHIGSLAYYNSHKTNKSEKFVFVAETDEGAFPPNGLNFTGSKTATKYMYQLLRLLSPLNVTKLYPLTDGGDVQPWIRDGVAGVWLENADWDDYYFRFHHTNGDTMTVFNSDDLDKTAAVWTVMTHVIANMEPSINAT